MTKRAPSMGSPARCVEMLAGDKRHSLAGSPGVSTHSIPVHTAGRSCVPFPLLQNLTAGLLADVPAACDELRAEVAAMVAERKALLECNSNSRASSGAPSPMHSTNATSK
jgi:hypothetical protein